MVSSLRSGEACTHTHIRTHIYTHTGALRCIRIRSALTFHRCLVCMALGRYMDTWWYALYVVCCVVSQAEPHTLALPMGYDQRLSPFEKVLLLKTLRPDKLVPVVQVWPHTHTQRQSPEVHLFHQCMLCKLHIQTHTHTTFAS